MFIKRINNCYYWYRCFRKDGKIVSQFLFNASKAEVKKWIEGKKGKAISLVKTRIKWSAQDLIDCHTEAQKLIKGQPCEICGKLPTLKHHPNYSKPLLVVYLCHSCHRHLHYLLKNYENTEMRDLYEKDFKTKGEYLAYLKGYKKGVDSCRNRMRYGYYAYIEKKQKEGKRLKPQEQEDFDKIKVIWED